MPRLANRSGGGVLTVGGYAMMSSSAGAAFAGCREGGDALPSRDEVIRGVVGCDGRVWVVVIVCGPVRAVQFGGVVARACRRQAARLRERGSAQVERLRADGGGGGADEAIKELKACGIDLAKLDRVRVAIGEPLRIAAEIDGPIDAKAVTCAAGPLVTSLGVHVVDRPGGIAFDYQTTPATTSPLAADVMKRCPERCAILRAGPASRTLWLAAELGDDITLRISGDEIQAGLAAFAAATRAIPALEPAHIEERTGTLVVHFPTDPLSIVGVALAVRANLFEAFKIPSSSMEPTLHIGDHLFIVKGPLAGPITPGDVLVYTTDDDHDFIKRYMGAPGQTLDDSDAGMVVDGKVLPSEVVDANYSYEDGEPGHMERRAGIEVREHFGARSYLVLRPEHPRRPGPWKVPPGTAFFVARRDRVRSHRLDHRAGRERGAQPRQIEMRDAGDHRDVRGREPPVSARAALQGNPPRIARTSRPARARSTSSSSSGSSTSASR